MEEVEKIRNHALFILCYCALEKAEEKRLFCRHQMPHLLDVARIAYIRNMEKKLGFSKQLVYAAAILHDIGKAEQYEKGTPHEQSGARIAEKILNDVHVFSEKEQNQIITAILEHRTRRPGMSVLGALLYDADKQSRACYTCGAQTSCNWSAEKKNKTLEI